MGVMRSAVESRPNIKILAIIPAYNEARYIETIVEKTQQYVDRVVVIDDGSTDGTGVIAEAAGAAVVVHECNRGKGAAIRSAFQIARSISPEAVVLLDGDGQHDPQEIPLLLEPVLGGKADMVVGSRFLRGNHIPRYRMLGLTVLTLITNIGSGISITDTQSGFRTFSKKAFESMTLQEQGFAVESEMQFCAGELKLRVVEAPIATNYDDRPKRSPVIHGFSVLIQVVRMCLLRNKSIRWRQIIKRRDEVAQ
jgi:glycosyltransferase involved in cell wall biosynthesis